MRFSSIAAAAVLHLSAGWLCAQKHFDREPILYSSTQPTDQIASLQAAMESGRVTLKRNDSHGYLQSLLEHLDIPVSSQVLVFSKTSFQRHRISRRTPRALYFNDDIYIGWVQQGDMIEISSTDRDLGAVFYTLDQTPQDGQPTIVRQTGRCILCHASTHTRHVPGHILRSILADRSSKPVPASSAFRTDHTIPLERRWGGWYVTGTHGRQRHMGNEVVTGIDDPDSEHLDRGANVSDLSSRIDTAPYLSPHSDIVALMVLAHQAYVHNEITIANMTVRRALHDETANGSDVTQRTIETSADRLLEWLLLSREAELTDEIIGTSSFARDFESAGPYDDSGRSLRQLDLKRRLFQYPCSFLIYTEAFDALPTELLDVLYQKLWKILNGEDESPQYAHLSMSDRGAIRKILSQTKPTLPEWWKSQPVE